MSTVWVSDSSTSPDVSTRTTMLSLSLIRDLESIPGVSVQADAPLAALTTIRTGGAAAVLVTVEDVGAAVSALTKLRSHDVPCYHLGAGSDLLVADAGYPGAVVRLGDGFMGVEGVPGRDMAVAYAEDIASSSHGEWVVTVGGAVPVAQLAGEVGAAGLTGLEFACGIPGSIGGGVATNAGAYGRAFADVLVEVELASAEGAGWVDVTELDWRYRHCRLPEGALVTTARFRLEPGDSEVILERHRSILEMRQAAQPQGVLTFGSTFKNPSGGAAGRLLDAAGLRGERRGDAEVSRVHANFVVNLGEASTADVLTLMTYMRQRVYETSGVSLEPEVRLLGAVFPWESSKGGVRSTRAADG